MEGAGCIVSVVLAAILANSLLHQLPFGSLQFLLLLLELSELHLAVAESVAHGQQLLEGLILLKIEAVTGIPVVLIFFEDSLVLLLDFFVLAAVLDL